MGFERAEKRQSKLRLGLVGPSGSGKTYSALAIAVGLGKRVAVIDTERGSASLYADRFTFDKLELESFSPAKYVEAIHDAERAGYDVVVIDSLTHAWSGKDGALEQVDTAMKRTHNKFTAWGDVTPLHNQLVDAMLQCKAHLLVTMRAKTEYVLEMNEKGKQVPRKVGMAPIQRDGMEYEFTVVGDIDLDHNYIISKTRVDFLDGKIINKPGARLATDLLDWLNSGAPALERPAEAPPAVLHAHPLEAKIAGVTTLADLDNLTAELKRLPEKDRDYLRPIFQARKAELAA
jgi:hypothetical protein